MNKKAFALAFPRTLPVLVGYLALGMGFGLLLSNAGYGVPWALLMGTIILAGSGQYLGVSLLATLASLPQVALLTVLINFRHFIYGLSMIERYKTDGKKLWYLAFAMTDETYALLSMGEPPKEVAPTDYYFAVSMLDHFYWILGGVLGCALGELLHFDTTGVDFAMTSLFVVLAINQWKKSKMHLPVFCGLGCGVLALALLGADMFLIPSLFILVALLLLLRGRIFGLEKEGESCPKK